MDPFSAALAIAALAKNLSAGKKQKEMLEAERKRTNEAQMEAEERMRASEQAAGQPIRQAMAGAKTALSARDPFMEQAVQQGAYQQTAAETRKTEVAAGGIGAGGRVRGAAGARAAAAAQGLMSRESMRIQRQRELNQLIGQQAGQLAEISMTGMRTREQTIAGYQQRLSDVRMEQAALPDPTAQALTAAVQFAASEGAYDDIFGKKGADDALELSQTTVTGLEDKMPWDPGYTVETGVTPDWGWMQDNPGMWPDEFLGTGGGMPSYTDIHGAAPTLGDALNPAYQTKNFWRALPGEGHRIPRDRPWEIDPGTSSYTPRAREMNPYSPSPIYSTYNPRMSNLENLKRRFWRPWNY